MLFLSIVLGILLAVLVLAAAYRHSGLSVFGTAGHTSSEFKLVLFVNAACVIYWISAGLLLTPEQASDAPWGCMAAVNIAYVLGRAALKCVTETCCMIAAVFGPDDDDEST